MTPLYKFLAMGLLMVMIFGCAREEPIAPKTVIPLVKTQVIHTDPSDRNIKLFNGIAEGIEEITLSFRVPGVLQQMVGQVGDSRNEGDLIAALDPRDFIYAVDDLMGQLESAEAQLEALESGERKENIRKIEAQLNSYKSKLNTAELEYRRVQQLYANDAAPKSRLDQSKSDMDLADANLKAQEEEYQIALKGARQEDVQSQIAKIRSIQANLDKAQADLKDTQLKMPFNGVISVEHTSNFEQINKDQEIYTVVAIDRMEVKVSIPEHLIGRIKKGQIINTELLTLPGKKFKGKITKVGQAADKTTLTYPIWVELQNRKRVILPGMSAEVSIVLRDMGPSFPLLPIHAVLEDKVSKNRFIWVFDKSTSTATKKTISIGGIAQNEIEVIKGVKKGDVIIVAGLDKLKDGMEVRYRKDSPPTQKPVKKMPKN